MPSPSKIPLPTKLLRVSNRKNKVPCQTKQENVQKVCSLKGKENVKPHKIKSAPSKTFVTSQPNCRTLPVSKPSKNAPKTTQLLTKPAKVGDRRGVSEIKRSEQNLRNKVMQLEDEAMEMQSQLEEFTRRFDVSKQLVGTLTEEKSELIARNERLGQILEKENVNPVTGNPMKFSPSFERRMESQTANNANVIDAIVASIKGLDSWLDEAAHTRLNAIVVPTLTELTSSVGGIVTTASV